MSMRPPVLISFATTSLVLAAIIETLAQQSELRGGLALSPSINDIPGPVTFAYLFLPTIVAVIYSLLWSWIDLDVKRMQPWLELSRQGGTTAENSLFLDYPYDFVAIVPFKAAKRRYIMLLTFRDASWLTKLQALGCLLRRHNYDDHLLDDYATAKCTYGRGTSRRSSPCQHFHFVNAHASRKPGSGHRSIDIEHGICNHMDGTAIPAVHSIELHITSFHQPGQGRDAIAFNQRHRHHHPILD